MSKTALWITVALLWSLTAGVALGDEVAGGGAVAELKPGDTLGKDNWSAAQGLLPPEILKHYQDGGYANPIVDWPPDKYVWPDDFLAGSKQNSFGTTRFLLRGF